MVMLPVLLGVLIGSNAKASNMINTDINTKTNTVFQNTFIKANKNIFVGEGINNPVDSQIKTEEEIKNEAIIDRWKSKQADKWILLTSDFFIINASAYTAAADECGKSDGVTSSGIKAKAGRTIACPANFPFGAKIKIADMGIFTCEDRGGAIKGNKIDIFMQTKQEAFAFGRKNLEAQVIL